jgi:hypothetical protein
MNIPEIHNKPNYAEVERFARLGMTAGQIVQRLRLDASVLEVEKFTEAVEYWRMVGLSEIADRCYQLAMGGNLRAITFLLKAVGGWSESRRSGGGEGGGPRWDRFLLQDAPDFSTDAAV